MSQMTPSQARVIDPLLTEVALGYEAQNSQVAEILFPVVEVGSRAGTIITFGKEQFQVISSKRAPGSAVRSVQVGYGSGKFALVDDALAAKVPEELQDEAGAVPGIDLLAHSINVVLEMKALEREVDAAALARNPNAYASTNKSGALSGSNKFTHADSKPFNVFEAGKEAVRKKVGRRPNVAVVPPGALSALRNHPLVLDRISTSTDRMPATLAQLQALFEVDRFVEAGAIQNPGTGDFVDVWGNDIVLAYVSPKSLQAMGSMNYGYTYRLRGRPVVEQPYYDKTHRSWLSQVVNAQQAVLTSVDSGYLIQGAV